MSVGSDYGDQEIFCHCHRVVTSKLVRRRYPKPKRYWWIYTFFPASNYMNRKLHVSNLTTFTTEFHHSFCIGTCIYESPTQLAVNLTCMLSIWYTSPFSPNGIQSPTPGRKVSTRLGYIPPILKFV